MDFLRPMVVSFNKFIIYYFLAISTIYFLQLVLSSVRLSEYLRKMLSSDYRRYMASANMVPVSLLVPAHNEEDTIVDTVSSLLGLEYPLYEVIVINDGSTDETLARLVKHFNLMETSRPIRVRIPTRTIRGVYINPELPSLRVIDKEPGGKADALNAGINAAVYPVVVSIDADSLLQSDSLVRVMMPFLEDPDMVAVGGIVRVANGCRIRGGVVEEARLPQSRLACLQVVEYLRAFLTGRMGWDALGSLLIISGAFGAFNREEIIKVGGYARDTVGEDMEVVVRLHRHLREAGRRYRIRFIPDPVCWTQVPETLADLRTQRQRWQVGLVDSLLRHKKLLFNPRYRVLGLYAVPYFWFFEMLGPVVEVLGYALIPLSFLLGLIHVRFFYLFLALALLYGIILSVGAILLEEYTFNNYKGIRDFLRLLGYAIIENLGYRQITSFFRVLGLFQYNRLRHSWGSVARRKFATLPENLSLK